MNIISLILFVIGLGLATGGFLSSIIYGVHEMIPPYLVLIVVCLAMLITVWYYGKKVDKLLKEVKK